MKKHLLSGMTLLICLLLTISLSGCDNKKDENMAWMTVDNVTVGKTTEAELIKAWGSPEDIVKSDNEKITVYYYLESRRSVGIKDGKVSNMTLRSNSKAVLDNGLKEGLTIDEVSALVGKEPEKHEIKELYEDNRIGAGHSDTFRYYYFWEEHPSTGQKVNVSAMIILPGNSGDVYLICTDNDIVQDIGINGPMGNATVVYR